MATHSSILVWKIPWMEEPGGLQSMGLQRVRHDWATEHKTKPYNCKELALWGSLLSPICKDDDNVSLDCLENEITVSVNILYKLNPLYKFKEGWKIRKLPWYWWFSTLVNMYYICYQHTRGQKVVHIFSKAFFKPTKEVI